MSLAKVNVVANAISRLPKEQRETPVKKKKLEAELCALLVVNDLNVTEMAECLTEVEQKLELASDNAQALKIKAVLTDPKSEWEYKDVQSRRLRPCPN